MGRATFIMPPFHKIISKPPQNKAAPNNPPMRAYEELLGMPKYQVIKFQAIAPDNAEMIMGSVAALASIRPVVIVSATPLICVAPRVLSTPAMTMAIKGLSTLVAMTVETTFAAS